MTAIAAATGFSRDAWDEFGDRRREPDWLAARRRAAYDAYEDLLDRPLDAEEFKRVDLRAFRPEQYRLATGESATAGETIGTLMQGRAEFGGAVIHVDGAAVQSSLSPELAKRGVLFGDLSALLASHRAVLEPHLMSRGMVPDADRFAAWHAAFWTGGTVLYVPRNVAVDVPLYSLISLHTDGVADF
ncbi:MAG: Fe-S cluster assembly protein SufD, partial [Planctomycetaceae bacterium]